MLVAIDFGISNTDLAVLDKDNVSFYSAPSQSSEINDGTIKNLFKKHGIDISYVKIIGVTGGKSSRSDDLPPVTPMIFLM